MSHCERLLQNYQSFVRLPWPTNLSGKQRVWFGVYPPSEERRVRAHIQEFQVATIDGGHKWRLIDITDLVPRWLAAHPCRDGYMDEPSALATVEEELKDHAAGELRQALATPEADENTVVAIMGVGALFGFTHVAPIIGKVEGTIRGRLLVFFPGEYERNQYRLMDARDGFNYMAVPITSNESLLAR